MVSGFPNDLNEVNNCSAGELVCPLVVMTAEGSGYLGTLKNCLEVEGGPLGEGEVGNGAHRPCEYFD